MKKLLLPLTILYRIYFALIFFVVLAILYPIFWLLLLKKSNYPKVFKLKVFTARLILIFDFIGVRKTGKNPLPENGPYVVCANHSSYLDIILMYRVLPKNRFLFIGKSELLKWPVINIFFKKLDITVDRKKRSSGVQSILKAKEGLDDGWSIVIFPEGGIPDNAPVLNRFKNGAFGLAIDKQVPILPITILDNWKLFGTDPILTAYAQPGISNVIIHPLIKTEGLSKKDLISLREQTFNTIEAPLLKKQKNK